MVDEDALYLDNNSGVNNSGGTTEWTSNRAVEFLQMAREEAHRTVDNQVGTLNDIDDKAARLLRVNLIVLGIILTGLSVSFEGASEPRVTVLSNLMNIYTTVGLILLFGSTIVAGLTLTASHMRAGMSGQNLVAMLWNDYSDRENLEGMIESYGTWIRENYRTNALNAPLGTITTLLLVYALTCFALGVFQAGNGSVPTSVNVAVLVVLSGVTYLSGIVGQVRRYLELHLEAQEEKNPTKGS